MLLGGLLALFPYLLVLLTSLSKKRSKEALEFGAGTASASVLIQSLSNSPLSVLLAVAPVWIVVEVWSDVPIQWARKDERRVPEHWKRFGSRISPLTHSPRLAANPPNAILNFLYLYAVLDAESRLAASAMGLDPGIGCLHVDSPKRDSLACDLMESVRAKVDAFVLDWITHEPLRRSDFWEDRDGNCRLVSALAIQPFPAVVREAGRRVSAVLLWALLWQRGRFGHSRAVDTTAFR